MDNMTEDEKKIVEELRRRTINDVTPKMLADVSVFYRFAKARDFHLEDAEAMLRKHITWRKENQIDTILTDYEPPEVLVKYIGTSFVCFDREQSIVRMLDCGRIDTRGLWNVADKAEIAKFGVYILEQDFERVIQRGGNFGKPMLAPIKDFENLQYANAVSIKTVQHLHYLLKIFTDNYPETIRNVTVINTPFYFPWAFAALKPALPPALIQKIRIYCKDGWKESLLESIDAEDLPAYLGGKKTDPDGNPLCKTFIKRGLPIPRNYYMQKKTKILLLSSGAKKLKVMPFSKDEISIEVQKKNSYLEWEFELKNGDIDFSLVFEESSNNSETVELFPKQRIDTDEEPEKGIFKCEKEGNYTVVFDNSYSWLHSKEVYYRITIKDPKLGEVYNPT